MSKSGNKRVQPRGEAIGRHSEVANRHRRPARGRRQIDLEGALSVLRRQRRTLGEMGVLHAGIFGSLARGKSRAASDIDVFVVLDESRHLSVYDFVGIKHHLQELLSKRVDLVERDAMKPHIRERALADAVHAF